MLNKNACEHLTHPLAPVGEIMLELIFYQFHLGKETKTFICLTRVTCSLVLR